MKILICIDDTDDVSKETSTGKIAGIIGKKLKSMGGVMGDGVSRHQLLLSEKVKYTSHNSSMCLDMELPEGFEDEKIIEVCRKCIRENMSAISDPGLAICWVDKAENPEKLIAYGLDAKKLVLTKEQAYGLAEEIPWVFLEELGGDGSGVIGALAGIGLRLSKCDGAIRGRLGEDLEDRTMSADEFCSRFGADFVVDIDGNIVDGSALVTIDDWARLMYYDGHKVSLALKINDEDVKCSASEMQCSDDVGSESGAGDKQSAAQSESNVGDNQSVERYMLISHHQVREQLGEKTGLSVCSSFVSDNDEEECISLGLHACFNCLYRRWTEGGFKCMHEGAQE